MYCMGLPSGMVTFLIIDGQCSTSAIWGRGEIEDAIARHGGHRAATYSDGLGALAVFSRAADAIAAAAEVQRSTATGTHADGGGSRLRMAAHTGDCAVDGLGIHRGPAIQHTTQVLALAHEGQILVTASVAGLAAPEIRHGLSLRDIGEHRLRDLSRAQRLYQLVGEALPDDFPPLRDLGAARQNLPIPLTSFVGRVVELADVGGLLHDNRLVTLTGPGGAGKTRLALHVAGEATGTIDVVCWHDLATVTSPDEIGRSLLAAMGVRGQPMRSPMDVLVDQAAGEPTLVVLDNCEHLVGAIATFVDALLARAPTITMLTTSREPLGVHGEIVYRVPSMPMPDTDGHLAIDVVEADAVRLFVDRARLVRPKFALDETTVGPVVDICRRVDALPLAIELAAARVRMMSPAAIADALHDRFRVLGGGSRNLMARQQTLRASVDWSYAMLSPTEQSVLENLTVFVGTFSLSAAEAVAGADDVDQYLVLDCLARLVDKSLVQADPEADEPRYRLLETIRQYAAERLFDTGKVEAARDRHLDWFARRCADAAVGLDGPELSRWVSRLSQDRPNLAAAFDWAVERADADRMWSMCGALTFWWSSTGHFVDARRWFEACLQVTGDAVEPNQVAARWGAAHLALFSGEFERGTVLGEETLRIALAAGDAKYTGRSLNSVGMITMFDDRARGEQQLRDAVEIARRVGDLWCLADALETLAILHLSRGDLAEGQAFFEESLPIARHLDNAQLLAWEHAARGFCRMRLGDFPSALDHLESALRQAARTGDPNVVAWLTAWRAMCEMGMGRADRGLDPIERAMERCHTVGAGQGALVLATASIPIRLAVGDATGAQQLIQEWLPVVAAEMPTVAAILGPYVVATALATGDCAEARGRLAVVRDCAERSGSRVDTAISRLSAGVMDLLDTEVAAAEIAAQDALPVLASGPFPVELVDVFALLAGIAAARGQLTEAARLWGVSDGIAARHGIAWTPLRQWVSNARQTAVSGSDRASFDQAVADGAAMTLEEAVAWVRRARGERGRPQVGWDSLTPTERRVVELAAAGLSNPKIGERMFISAGTVKTHLAHVYAKLGLANRTEVAAAFAERAAGRANTAT